MKFERFKENVNGNYFRKITGSSEIMKKGGAGGIGRKVEDFQGYHVEKSRECMGVNTLNKMCKKRVTRENNGGMEKSRV